MLEQQPCMVMGSFVLMELLTHCHVPYVTVVFLQVAGSVSNNVGTMFLTHCYLCIKLFIFLMCICFNI
jgi:hypothetical protein